MGKNKEKILVIGLSHKTAPVIIREKLFQKHNYEILKSLISKTIPEAVILTTCNRFEIYCTTHSPEKAINLAFSKLKKHYKIGKKIFDELFYCKEDKNAIKHLFSVTASLDSMVVGENEIINQVKDAYAFSVEHKFTGTTINKLFHEAFRVAKLVKTETEISSHPVSISYIATILVKNIFKNLSSKNILVLGAGRMTELLLKYLKNEDIKNLCIANRSQKNAMRLINKCGISAKYTEIKDLENILQETDLIISSIACDNYILEKNTLKSTMQNRKNRPMVIIDIGVPRNVDPNCKTIGQVFLHNIDDLQTIAYQNQVNRTQEIEFANKLIKKAASSYLSWKKERTIVPVISRVHNKFDKIRTDELNKYRKKHLNHLTEKDYCIIEELTRSIMNKTLHNPISYIKKTTQKSDTNFKSKKYHQIIEDMLTDENKNPRT